jgi:chemotaxis-related protein WspB
MLFLIFELGADRYALDAASIVEVLPVVRIKTMPHAPPGVIGVFNHHGAPVPAIDLSELTLGRRAASLFSTRLIVVSYRDRQGGLRRLGLIAERATDTMRREAADFVASGIVNGRAPYLGPVATDSRGVLQRIDVETLLPATVQEVLFAQLADP